MNGTRPERTTARRERARNGIRPGWTVDEVTGASLDSFPASDPPSWSPVRVGGPKVRDPLAHESSGA